jgi:hypothetical protein
MERMGMLVEHKSSCSDALPGGLTLRTGGGVRCVYEGVSIGRERDKEAEADSCWVESGFSRMLGPRRHPDPAVCACRDGDEATSVPARIVVLSSIQLPTSYFVVTQTTLSVSSGIDVTRKHGPPQVCSHAWYR